MIKNILNLIYFQVKYYFYDKLIFPESGFVSNPSPNSSSKISSYLSSEKYPSSLFFSYLAEEVDCLS